MLNVGYFKMHHLLDLRNIDIISFGGIQVIGDLLVEGPGSLQLGGDHVLAVPLHHAVRADQEGQGEEEESDEHVVENLLTELFFEMFALILEA